MYPAKLKGYQYYSSTKDKMVAPPVVDINKLKYLTKNLPQSSKLKDSVDFSDFANKNFEKSVKLTQQPKKVKTRKQSKWVYNEVQRNSINFGVSPEEMIAYHNSKKFDSRSTPNLSDLPHVPKSPATQIKRQNIHDENKEYLTSIVEKPALRSPLITSRSNPKFNGREILPGSTPPPRPKTKPPRLDLERLDIGSPSTAPSFELSPANRTSPERRILNSPSPSRKLESEEPPEDKNGGRLSGSSSFSITKPSPINNNSKDVSNGDWKSRLSSSQLRRRLSQASSKSSLTGANTKSSDKLRMPRECHSVEETLMADEEFKDFTIPLRSSSYYSKTNEFNFEKPSSNETSRSTSLGGTPKRLMSPEFTQNSMLHIHNTNHSAVNTNSGSPITPKKLRQRHSFGDFPKSLGNDSPLHSPALSATRSSPANDSYNPSQVRYSPRMSLRTSMSDLKSSQIEKIAEHEILHFGFGK